MKIILIILVVLALSFSLQGLAQDRSSLPLPGSGNVTLPLDEYNKLVDLAGKPVVKPESPPAPYAIKRADLKFRVTNDSVLGTVQCDGEVFTKGVVKIPLMNAPAVLDARQAGKPLPLQQQSGMQTAVLTGPSDFSIMLDAGLPLNIEAGRASFNLPASAAGSVLLSLEIPGEHTNVKINSGLITSRSTKDGRTVIEAILAPGRSTGVWWTTREIVTPAVPHESRFLSLVKTLASVSEADLKLTVLADIIVIQGEPAQFEMEIPPGFELAGVTGASLESEEMQSGRLVLKIDGPSKRNHQFLISLEQPIAVSKADIPFLSFMGAQRETGEVLIEGEGTMELRATEGGVLKRIDIKETNSYLRSLARFPLHAAFRYHRQTSEPPSLKLDWNRFPGSGLLAAAAELAEVTTLVTSEGRSLTEVKLMVKNHAQPFLKVGLPSGASILTAEVAGEKVKPVQGADGMRVPLLRPGFRPSEAYLIAFVFVHAGTPFAKKGDSELALPKMDIPISLLRWEVFIPSIYTLKNFGGDAMAVFRLPAGTVPSFAALGNAPNVNVQKDGVTANNVRWVTGMNTPVNLNPQLVSEFKLIVSPVDAEMGRGSGQIQVVTRSGGNAYGPVPLNTSVPATTLETMTSSGGSSGGVYYSSTKPSVVQSTPASANVVDFQKRVSGVLPISVDVPRAGNSYSFVRPLVLNEETKMTFRYKTK
jgi:hypothetical protein